jgi:hypothetical protein
MEIANVRDLTAWSVYLLMKEGASSEAA